MPQPLPLSSSRSPRRTWFQRTFLFFAVAAVLAFQVWTVRTSTPEWPRAHGEENDYYNLLSRGFLSGHLNLKRDPDPELLRLSDPYDPQKRVGIPVLHDVSLYHGKYYLYWGPAPVVALFLPFRVLTGCDLPQMYGNLLFVAVGYLALASLWWRIRRDYFPQSHFSIEVIGLLALAAGGMTLSLVRRPSLWELPIASGYACAMVGLACVYSGLCGTTPKRWWALASVALAMAVASRPTYAFGAAPLLLILAWQRARALGQAQPRGILPARAWWGEMIALGLPICLVVLGLLLYNYERFDHWFEFGLKYQLSGTVELTATHFSPRYAAYNAYLYYFSPAQWSRYFPFVQVIPSGVQPHGYYGIEYTYGLLLNEPLTLFALFLPLAFWRRTPSEKAILVPIIFGISSFFVGVTALLLCFWAGTQRYMADFAPSLILLGCVGLLALERWLEDRSKGFAVAGRWLGIGAAAFTIFFGVVISFQLHGLLRYFSPDTFNRLAHAFNYPSYAVEKLTKFSHGPLEMDVQFPKDRIGKFEPLLSTGWEFFSDQVFVQYVDDHHVRFGFDHLSRGSRTTEPIEIDYTAAHHLRLELGSLYPPESHPFFDGKSDLERTSLADWLCLTVDNKIVMEGRQLFYDASPESLQIGGTTATRAYGDRFTGQILHVKRGAYHFLSIPQSSYGSVTLKLGFPRDVDDRSQPLVDAGTGDRADTVYVRYLRDGYVRFGYEHRGTGTWESGEVAVDLDRPEELEIYLPALFAPHDGPPYSPLSRRLVMLLDQKLVWAAELPSYVVPPFQVSIGRNLSNSSACETDFSGVIGAIKRNPDVGEPARRGTDQVDLRLIFPHGHVGRHEPLFVRGATGAADILLVQYIDEGHIRFGFDHWGVGMVESDPVSIDFDAIHDLDLRLMAPPGTKTTGPGMRHVTLTLDGKAIWSTDAVFHPATPETVSVGVNHIGASTCDEVFNGVLLKLGFPSAGAP